MTLPSILYVDDEILSHQNRRLDLAGQMPYCHFVSACGPRAAVDIFRSSPFDVVVSEVDLLDHDGEALIPQLLSIDPHARIIVTAPSSHRGQFVSMANLGGIFRLVIAAGGLGQLVDAVEEALRLARFRTWSSSIETELLDAFAAALVVVDGDGRTQYLNQAARMAAAAADGITIGSDRVLRASTSAQNPVLHGMIRRAAEHRIGGCLALECPKSERVLAARIEAGAIAGDRALVTIHLRHPGDWEAVGVDQVMSLFHLTHAEARIACSLSRGLSLTDSAAASAITVGTARNYLKRIFIKTGTARQVDLINLLLSYASPFHRFGKRE